MRVISRGRDLHLARWLALHPGWYCGPRPATAPSAVTPSGRQAPPPGRAERKKVMRTASQAVLLVLAFLCVAITTTAATAQTPPTIPCSGAFGTCLGSCPAGQQCIPDPTTTLCGCVTVTTTTLSSTTTTTSSVTTTTLAACCGFSPKPSELSFTTSIGAGNCGTVQNSAGTVTKQLACGGLYTGGGSNSVPLPYAVPDMGNSLTGVSSCSGSSLTLANLTSAQTGSNRNCTSVGCLFGPPLPIPNPSSPPTSVCVINTVSTNASGTADCGSGASQLSLPLTSTLYLDGDLFPNAPGIQVCPVCTKACNTGANNGGPCNGDADCANAGCTGAGVPMPCCTGFQTGTCTAPGSCAGANACHGGPNNGMPCTPAASPISQSFPTTHDCPPPPSSNIGNLPIAFALTTGT